MNDVVDTDKLVADYHRGIYCCAGCSREVTISAEFQLVPRACPVCSRAQLLPKQVGPFWLFRKLGQGGRGSVFLAFHDRHRGSRYAVKLASRHRKDEARDVRALQREANVASGLDVHPNLVTIIAQGMADDEFYMAMEYVPGETLSSCIARRNGLLDVEVIKIGRQLIAALQHIMAQGYLYRDLKPENIIVSDSGRVVLFDFGLCLPLEVAATREERPVEGSPIYVPPERLLVGGEDCRSEVYSLGMLIYHMAAGKPYYTAEEVYNLVRQHVSEVRMRTKRIRLLRVPRDLMGVISRMIKRDPNDRYPTLAAVDAALAELLANRASEPDIQFRRPPPPGAVS